MPFSIQNDPSALLAKLIRLSNSNTQFEFKVANFLNLLTWELALQHCLLLTLDRESNLLSTHRAADTATPYLSRIRLEDNIIGRVLTSRQSLKADEPDLTTLPADWQNFLKPFIESIIIVPLCDDKTSYGTILLLSRHDYELSGSRTILVEAVANELAIVLKNNEHATDVRKKLSVLNVLSELGRTLASTLEVNKVMHIIPQIAAGVFLADGCTLNVLNYSGHKLQLYSQYGTIPPAYNFDRYHGLNNLPPNISKAMQRNSSFIGFAKDDPNGLDLTPAELYDTIISAPLMFQGHYQGSITLFNKLGGLGQSLAGSSQPFNRDDLELLFSMNSMISGVIENAITFKEMKSLAQSNQKMVSYLSSLYEISSAMMTTVRFDELIWIIIKALTLRQGLAFDQVMILMLNKDKEGGSYLSCAANWSYDEKVDDPTLPLEDILKTPSLEEAAQMLKRGENLSLHIPVTKNSNRILAKVAYEKKALLGFRTFDATEDLDLRDFGLRTYAAVPMVAKNQEVGVIAVDRSLASDPLTSDNLRDLTMMANQAALAIENAKLYDDIAKANQTLSQVRSQLIETEKMAAQGEMGTQLAHEVRNPLVSIGGFTQRLLKKMAADDPLRNYAEVIWEEVQRVNKVLNNILDFSRDEKGLVRNFYMEDLVRETLDSLKHELIRNKIEVETCFDKELPQVAADDRQVMHILLNIIYNASQAMGKKGGKIYIRLYEYFDHDLRYVACELTDTGPGIPVEVLPTIFSPFFTTKTQGTGLGLSIVNKIVKRYHGRINATNHPPHVENGGACFTFMFPAANAGSITTA